jgi:predicted transcriptional regulator
MTTSITFQLPDEVAQQLQAEAQQQNTTVERFLTQHLTQTLQTAPKEQQSSMPHREWLAGYFAVAEMFSLIRAAQQFKQNQVQLPVTPLSLHIANFLAKHNIIHSIEIDLTPPSQSITLHLLEEMPVTPQYDLDNLLKLPTENPELKQILENLQDSNPNICIQGINALGDLYGKPA